MDLKYGILNVVDFLKIFCYTNLQPHFGEATFKLKLIQIWLSQNFTYSCAHYFSVV
jgi:hypothetical protein